MYTRGGGTQPEDEAVFDTGEGLTTEGPGNKVRTPGVGEGGVGGEGAQVCRGEGTKEHGRKYNGIKEIYYEVFLS